MDTEAQAAVLCALASVAFLYVIRNSWNLGRRLPNMPPGPPTKPIIGNMLDMTNRRLHLRFHQWGEYTFQSQKNSNADRAQPNNMAMSFRSKY